MLRIQIRKRGTDFPCGHVGPAHQAHLPVEEQIAAGFPFAHQKCRDRLRTCLGLEPGNIQIGQDIYIVDQDGLFAGKQKRGSMRNASAGFQKLLALVGNGYGKAEVMGGQIFTDLPCKVMHVNNQFGVTGGFELANDVIQKRLPAHRHQGLGQGVGDGLQAGSQTRRKDHRLHG